MIVVYKIFVCQETIYFDYFKHSNVIVKLHKVYNKTTKKGCLEFIWYKQTVLFVWIKCFKPIFTFYGN